MSNRRIEVREPAGWSWRGSVLWEEKGFGKDVCYVVRPDEAPKVLARRGAGTREYHEQLIRIPSFADHSFLVTRKNLMTGLEYEETEDTPWCCSAASESYWCS